jgi:hypothetical protein
MRKVIATLLALCLLTFVGVEPATAALKPATHEGFFIGVGIGGGSLKVKFDGVDGSVETDSETGGAGSVHLGFAISPKVLLGLDLQGWTKNYEDEFSSAEATWTFANVTGCVWFYPTEYFFLKGGPSIASSELTFEYPGYDISATEEGWGLMLGAGGELRLGSKFALIPQFQFMHQNYGEIAPDLDLKVNYFTLTLGVGWYW